MKQRAFQLVLAVSLLGAAILGVQILHFDYQFRQAVPEEVTYFPPSTAGFVGGLLIAISPVGLYLCCLIFARGVALSYYGKLVCVVQFLYVGLLVTDWFCAH